MNKKICFLSAALALALLTGCQSTAPSQGAEPAPQDPAAPAETAPVTPAAPAEGGGSIQFTVGTYLCGDVYYSFYDDASGSTEGKDSGVGLPFTYEVEGDQVTFHMGSMEDSTVATVTAVDEDTFYVKWEDGRQEIMTFVSYPGFEGGSYSGGEPVQFRLGAYLCGDLYYSFYMDGVSGSTSHKDSGTGVAFTYDVEGNRVTFHMGSAEENIAATVTAVDEDTFAVEWEDGRRETMTYVYEVIPELANYE